MFELEIENNTLKQKIIYNYNIKMMALDIIMYINRKLKQIKKTFIIYNLFKSLLTKNAYQKTKQKFNT